MYRIKTLDREMAVFQKENHIFPLTRSFSTCLIANMEGEQNQLSFEQHTSMEHCMGARPGLSLEDHTECL